MKIRRPKNSEVREREYLTPNEIERLIKAARSIGRHGHRDAAMILIAFRHGLRVSELVGLRWTQVLLDEGRINVIRLKGGVSGMQPLWGPEIRALRKIQREAKESPYVFVTERGGPLTVSTFQKLMKRAGEKAGLGFPVHPHQLRHSCGFKLANDNVDTRTIQAFMGHRSIQHTVRYTELAANRFDGLFKD